MSDDNRGPLRDGGPDDDACDQVAGGALGHWGLDGAAQVVRRMVHALFTRRNDLNLAVAKPTAPDPDGNGYVLRVEALTYFEAACSQAAIAGIAPLAESLVRKAEKKLHEHQRPGHRRAKANQSTGNQENFRHPTFVRNLREILKTLEPEPRDLPESSCRLLEAIFSYRKQVLHWGYEWPKEERVKFAELIEQRNWDGWFYSPTVDGCLWIFFLTSRFIKDAISGVEEIAAVLREIDTNLSR